MSTKILEIAPSLGKWALLHNHVALATFDTEDAAERAAQAIVRTQPAGDDAEVRILDGAVDGEARRRGRRRRLRRGAGSRHPLAGVPHDDERY